VTARAGLLIVLWLAPVSLRADDLISADRPGLANGSSTVGRGRFQVEVGLDRDRDGEEVDSVSTPFLHRLGVTDAFELRVEGDGRQWANSSRTERETGWAPVSVGFKYRLTEESGRRPAVGLIARVFPPSGSGAFKSDLTTGDAVLTLDKGFGEHWSINPNVGVAWLEDDLPEWARRPGDGDRFSALLAALTVQYSFMPTVGVFVDTAWQVPEVPRESPLSVVDMGAAWVVGRDTQLDASGGWGWGGDRSTRWFLSAGFSRRF
jgi:hypothetical protein